MMRKRLSILFISVGIGLFGISYIHENLKVINNQLEVSKNMFIRYTDEAEKIEGEPIILRSSISYPKEKQEYAHMQSEEGSVQEKIYFGDSEDILDIGVGQYMGSGIFGEGKPILLAGHNGTNFKGLQYVKDQEKIYVTTDYGNFVYRVYQTEIMKATDFKAEVLQQDKEILIMYTCYPFTAITTDYRYFVYAEKIDGVSIEEDGI